MPFVPFFRRTLPLAAGSERALLREKIVAADVGVRLQLFYQNRETAAILYVLWRTDERASDLT